MFAAAIRRLEEELRILHDVTDELDRRPEAVEPDVMRQVQIRAELIRERREIVAALECLRLAIACEAPRGWTGLPQPEPRGTITS